MPRAPICPRPRRSARSARLGSCGGQGGGHRRLADTTLARHDHDPGGGAEALEVHAPRCYGSPDRAPFRRAVVFVAARVAAHRGQRRSRRPPARRPPGRTRHRRRAGRGLLDSPNGVARPRRDRRGERAPVDAARAPAEVGGAIDVDVETSCAPSTAPMCRSRCGSDRRAPTRRARPRCSSRPRSSCSSRRGRASARAPGAARRARRQHPCGRRRPAGGARRAMRRDPDGARRLAGACVGATDACSRCDQRCRADRRRADRALDGRAVTTAAGELAVDGEGRRHRARPPAPAQPGGALRPPRARRPAACTG